MHSGSAGRLGSAVMPLRLSVLTWYWSSTQGQGLMDHPSRLCRRRSCPGFGSGFGTGKRGSPNYPTGRARLRLRDLSHRWSAGNSSVCR